MTALHVAEHLHHHSWLTLAAIVVGVGLLLGGWAIFRDQPLWARRTATREGLMGLLFIAFGAFIILVTVIRIVG